MYFSALECVTAPRLKHLKIGLRLNAVLCRVACRQLIFSSLLKSGHAHTEQDVALTGRNTTGPPWSVGRPTACAPGRPARRQCYRRRQTTTTDASEQNNTGPFGGPVITDDIVT